MKHPFGRVEDPEYRYPPSTNPYWAKLKGYGALVFSDNDTEIHRGKWRELFGAPQDSKLHLEIGCNAGHVVTEWARQSPTQLFLGMDWKFKAICKGADKAKKLGIRNLKFLRSYAERIDYVFGPEEIDHLYLFFPDPWPKRAQNKNRFLNPERLKKLAGIVRKGGTFELRTDHADYFVKMREAVAAASDFWSVESLTEDRHAGDPHRALELTIPEVTLFERIFIRQGIPIKRAVLVRR